MSTKFEDMDRRGPEHSMNHLDIERSSLAQADAEEDRRNLMDRIQQLVDELTKAPGVRKISVVFFTVKTIEKQSF